MKKIKFWDFKDRLDDYFFELANIFQKNLSHKKAYIGNKILKQIEKTSPFWRAAQNGGHHQNLHRKLYS